MRFLIDHNAPIDVSDFLVEADHDVVLVSDIMAPDSPDPVVAAAAMADERVLISHDKVMRRVEKLISVAVRERFPRLSRILLCCPEVVSERRVREFMPIIQAEFDHLTGQGLPMLFEIGERRARLIR